MKIFKSFMISFLVVCSIIFVGCEKIPFLICATISDITTAGSDKNVVRVSYQKDERINSKGVYVQVKFNKIGDIIVYEENEKPIKFHIDEIDEWYSMTVIISKGKNQENKEHYSTLKDALTQTYIWEYQGNIEICLRVVAGDITKNDKQTGEILTASEPISNQFVLKIK